MRRHALVALFASFAACDRVEMPWPQAPAVALDLRLTIEPTTVALLEPLTVQLDLFRRADIEVEFAPSVAPTDFQVETRVLPAQPLGHGVWQRTTLVLRPVRGPGELVLPPFVARAKDGTVAASTPEQTVTVTTLLATADDEVEAPAAPLPQRKSPWPYVAVALGLMALMGLLSWFTRRRSQRTHDTTELPPHAKALRALARLRTAARTTPAEIERFYVEVSDVLRVYLEERFALCAPERTTEEFLRELEAGDQLARDHRAELERFLSQCDLVKFAAHVPTENDHLATFLLAETFVERTRVDRVPTPEAK